MALTILVLAMAVGAVTWRLRAGLQQQVLRREAAVLTAVASMQLANASDAPDAMFFAVLRASTLHGVVAIQVFDAAQQFQGAEPFGSEKPPPAADWAALMEGRPVARLHRRETISELTGLLPEVGTAEEPVPLLEAWVPLRKAPTAPMAGAAQFWIDGAALAEEFRALNGRLLTQALLAWLAGAVVILAVLAWAFRRLALANQELRLRSENLQRANRELVLAAKSSALGSVTAHLIHALKNPIAGLETFVANQAEPSSRGDGNEELVAATELTRRLRTMVNDVVSVLRDEQTGTQFELSSGETVEIALQKIRPLAAARGVPLEVELNEPTMLLSRRAHLAALALYNLLQNAIEVSAAGHPVRLASRNVEGATEITVADRGPGLPAQVRERIFQPCTSTKLGGSGLGLALSQQLARQAGGRIELVRSDERGTCFRLVLDSAG